MKRIPHLAVLILVLAGLVPAVVQDTPPRPAPSSPEVLRAIVNEASGERALQNEIHLTGVNRNRKAAEYRSGYFESAFILEKLREYGLEDSFTLDLPVEGGTTWDAESAELWTVEPELAKIADLDDMPASLCSGSATTDTTAELVYVGPGDREEFYKDRDVEGKILLVNGSPERARRLGVQKYGAAGLVGWASSHPEFDRDEVGWNGLRLGPGDRATFGFTVSQRQGQDLRDALERGRKIVVRAVVKTQTVADYKDQLTVALIKGTERPDEELVFTAHLYEGWAKQGANDNASGCTAILETARVLRKLIAEGRIPPLKRSVRFLFVPEISGTAAYLRPQSGHPEEDLRQHQPGHGRRGPDHEPELQPPQPDPVVAADLPQRRHGLLLRVDGRFAAGRPGDRAGGRAACWLRPARAIPSTSWSSVTPAGAITTSSSTAASASRPS